MYFWILLYLPYLALSCPSQCSCSSSKVDCSRSGLTELPTTIPPFTKHLDVSGNNLEILNVSSLSTSIVSIDASDNRIRSIDESVYNLDKLSILNLRKNRLSSIPKVRSSLDRLDISSNLISTWSSDDVLVISTVRIVDLSRNKLSSIPTVTPSKDSDIEKLDLSGNQFHTLHANSFQFAPLLVSLRLHRNKINRFDKNSLKGLTRLEHLDLARNHLESIPALVFQVVPSLKYLQLARNRIHELEDGVFFGCDSLQSMNVSNNKMSNLSAGWLFGLQHLFSLDLSHNKFDSFDPNSWSQTPNLRHLSLKHNRLTTLPSGAFRLVPSLEHLLLDGNKIQSLHKTALTGLDRLESLDLSSNALAVCVEDGAVLYNTSMPYLRSLKFSNNQLKVVPSRAFFRFPALEDLDLSDNPIATLYPGAFEPLRLKKLTISSSSSLCDCHMDWFANWFANSGLDRRDISLKCAYPIPLRGINVLSIDSTNLTCVDDSPRARVIVHPEALVRISVGDSAEFQCKGYGHEPLSIEWQIVENGKSRLLENSTRTSISVNKTTIFNGTTTGQELLTTTLRLDDVTLLDKAEYQCSISNQFAKDYSIRAQLEVNQAPSFIREPDDMNLLVGQNAKIMCAATGVPAPVLRWSKDGDDQSFPAAFERRLHVRPNDDHLYVLNVSIADQGVYTCHVSNDAGSAQASATLRVFQNKFRLPLQDLRLSEGDTVVLDCLADIQPSQQRIEWTKDGEACQPSEPRRLLKADDQILVISKITPQDSGEYTCSLWAGADLLDRQTSRIDVLGADGRVYSAREPSRSRRWLPVSLAVLLPLGIIISGAGFSLLIWQRNLLCCRKPPEATPV